MTGKEKINDDALVVHLTVNQMKAVFESILQQSSSLSNSQPEIIDIEEVLKFTGYKRATIYKLIHERKIPFHKPAHGGRRVFFKSVEIDQWLQSNRIETNEEFLKNYCKNRKGQTDNKIQSQHRLYGLKTLYQLFVIFLKIVNQYKAQIQKLEEQVAKYETDNRMIENLFIDDVINTNEYENNRK